MKLHAFHPSADQEYTTAAQYYTRISPELGGRFYDEMERLICDIRSQPDRFRLFDPPVRRHFSDVFPYAILYVDQPDRIWVIDALQTPSRLLETTAVVTNGTLAKVIKTKRIIVRRNNPHQLFSNETS